MKNLQTLGAYIDELINSQACGVASKAAKLIGVSAAELHALRNGFRQSPNPDILMKLSQHLGGNYNTMMLMAGYVPPAGADTTVKMVPVVEKISCDERPIDNVIDIVPCPKAWLKEQEDAFIFRQPFVMDNDVIGFHVVFPSLEYNSGSTVLVSVDGSDASIWKIYKPECFCSVFVRQYGYSSPVCSSDFKVYGLILRSVLINKEELLWSGKNSFIENQE